MELKIVYVVYREEETTVFSSQVLKYLKKLKEKGYQVDLILFRHQKNLINKTNLEKKLNHYVSNCITIPSLPPLFMSQLDISASVCRKKIQSHYAINEPLIIMCRGEISTYLAINAFNDFQNKIIFFDNRGISIEELHIREKTNFVYSLNKNVKKRAISFSKDNSDVYSFVTNNLRDYMIEKYDYHVDKKYFIMPTLCDDSALKDNVLEDVKRSINYSADNIYFIYIGSNAMWQSMDKVFDVFQRIHSKIKRAKLIVLSKDRIEISENINSKVKNSIIFKSAPHDMVKYYLELSKIGFVLRDNSIVNKVAAPTKIAEYLTRDVVILFDGEIGVLKDISQLDKDLVNQSMISLNDKNWIEKIIATSQDDLTLTNESETIKKYFDMDINQEYLINQLQNILSEKYITNVKGEYNEVTQKQI